MPRTALTPVVPKGPYPGTVAALGLDFAFVAGDNAAGNVFAFTGRELILVQNTNGGGAGTFTLTSVNDPNGRKGDITAYSVGANLFSMFWVGNLIGWDQGGNTFYIDCSAATMKFAIIRIP
jgi:hypothetical protein